MPEISEQEWAELKQQVANLANQLNQARNRIDELEDFATDHIGLDWGESLVDANSPHPNISVNTIESGGGVIRQDTNGMQVQTEGSQRTALYFVDTLSTNPSSSGVDKGRIIGWGGGGGSGVSVDAYQSGFARASLYVGTDAFYAEFAPNYADDLASGGWGIDSAQGLGAAAVFSLNALDTTLLGLGQFTSDPTNFTSSTDGRMWYRTDLDKFRVRANGTTRNLALEDTLIHGDGSELTIATGAITITTGYHRVDTEADAASDDLDTISGGTTGQILVLRAENDARSVVAKDGTGNLKLAGDCTLDNTEDTLTLIYNGTNWLELSRSDNGA